MIYLNNLLITDDILFEKSRATHELFKKKDVTIKGNSGYRNKTDVTYHYFKIFEKGLSIDFNQPITIIAGDNGTGKTSLLQLIKYKQWKQTPSWGGQSPDEIVASQQKHANEYLKNESRTLSFSKMPATIFFIAGLHKNIIGGDLKKDTEKAIFNGTNLAQSVSRMFSLEESSNGEALLDIYEGLKHIKDSLVILDEPETSMSLKSTNKLCGTFNDMVKNNNQLIISTHHPYFMNLASEVYDIEKKKYVDRSQYLKSLSYVG